MRRREQQGFTLIEVSISLVILSMILVAVISSLRSFARTQESVTRVTEEVESVRMIGGFLRAAVSGALPIAYSGNDSVLGDMEGRRYSTMFSGTDEEMVWVAPISAGPKFGGLSVMRLSRRDKKLLLQVQSYRLTQPYKDWGDVESRVLLEDVGALEFGYRGDYGSDWLTGWSPGETNPVTVRVNLKVGERFWPELVIRLDNTSMALR